MCCIDVMYFSACENFALLFSRCRILCYIFMRSDISCYIFPRVEFIVIFQRVELALVIYFSACGTRSGISCCIFPPVEFRVIYFCVWNLLWYSMLYFSVCGTRSDILCYIFLRVERALIFCVIYFLDFIFIQCCIIGCIFLTLHRKNGIFCNREQSKLLIQ